MTKLLNDCFDILNGRFPKEGLSKLAWEATKKSKLQKMLYVLDLTEKIAKDPKRDREKLPDSMFMSDTTLVAWRLVILSSIGLIDELFADGYTLVLTGRFNQDPIEVILFFTSLLDILIIIIFDSQHRIFLELFVPLMAIQLPIRGFISLEYYLCTAQQKSQ